MVHLWATICTVALACAGFVQGIALVERCECRVVALLSHKDKVYFGHRTDHNFTYTSLPQ